MSTLELTMKMYYGMYLNQTYHYRVAILRFICVVFATYNRFLKQIFDLFLNFGLYPIVQTDSIVC